MIISYPFIFEIKKDNFVNRIDIFNKKEFPHNKESLGFDSSINETKNKIENISVDEWNKIRKIINPFDFPNLFNSKIKIFNRAFYKFWEIFHQFDLYTEYEQDIEKKSLHLAEAPGSFIHVLLFKNCLVKKKKNVVDSEGFIEIKRKKNKKEKYIHTISMTKSGYPKYNEQIINSPYVNFLESKLGDKTGNILQKDNIVSLINLQTKYSLITADAGIDEKGYYDVKEQIHLKLFLSEILIVLNTQKLNGNFVLKIYDIFTQPMVDLIWLLSQFYDKVYLYKPLTSRITNSEKYFICKNFKGYNNNIKRLTEQILTFLQDNQKDNIEIINFEVKPKPSNSFKEQFKTINENILALQNESIKKALDLIDKPIDKNYLEEQNILKIKNFIKWQHKYNLFSYLQ